MEVAVVVDVSAKVVVDVSGAVVVIVEVSVVVDVSGAVVVIVEVSVFSCFCCTRGGCFRSSCCDCGSLCCCRCFCCLEVGFRSSCGLWMFPLL